GKHRGIGASEDAGVSALNEEFGQQRAQKAREELREAISDVRAIWSSQRLSSIMNLRHKHLAHSLAQTNLEKKAGLVPPMKYGDEREVLFASLPIVEALHRLVNGTGFSFEKSQEIDRNNAEALWKRCTFDVQG